MASDRVYLVFCVIFYFIVSISCDPYEYSDCYKPISEDEKAQDFFKFSVFGLKRDIYDFQQYKGKVMLLANVASFCLLTAQYLYMNELQNKYGAKRSGCQLQLFVFPCNQFGYQEPAENFELMNCLKYVKPGNNFVPNFPVSGKLLVNGASENPIFTYLKGRCPAPMGIIANRSEVNWSPIRNNDISWNFAKWLIDHTGHPYRHYTPRTTPEAIEGDIQMLLEQCEANGAMKNNTETGNGQTHQQIVQKPILKPAELKRSTHSSDHLHDL